jgi:IS30 family transposase
VQYFLIGKYCMTSHYKQLSGVERAFIQLALSEKQKPSQIAQSLGRCSSTITRELRRNGWVRPRKIRFAGRPCLAGGYRAVAAQERAHDITHCSKVEKRLRPDTALWKEVMDHLKLGYSPEEIAGTLQAVHPNDPSLQLCHETIYTAIYAMPRGELRKEVTGWLRHGHTKRGHVPVG